MIKDSFKIAFGITLGVTTAKLATETACKVFLKILGVNKASTIEESTSPQNWRGSKNKVNYATGENINRE